MGGTSSGGGLLGSWGAGGGANTSPELARAGLTPAQANSLGVQVVGPGQQPPSGLLGGLSNFTSGATQGLYGNQGPGVTNAGLQLLGGLAGSRIMGGNPLGIGLQGLGNMASQIPLFSGIAESPMAIKAPSTKPVDASTEIPGIENPQGSYNPTERKRLVDIDLQKIIQLVIAAAAA